MAVIAISSFVALADNPLSGTAIEQRAFQSVRSLCRHIRRLPDFGIQYRPIGILALQKDKWRGEHLAGKHCNGPTKQVQGTRASVDIDSCSRKPDDALQGMIWVF
jgi:hypothetical protein